MEPNITIEEAIKWIAEASRTEVELSDDKYCFLWPQRETENRFELTNSQISQVLERLNKKQEFEEIAIYDQHSYEIIVREASINRGIPFSVRFRGDSLAKEDEVNKISYDLSKPSDEYLVFLLSKLAQIAPLRHSFSSYRPSRQRERTGTNILEMLKSSSYRFYTLKIESEHDRSVSDFVNYANSYFFQLGYNLDIAFMPQRYLNDLVRTSRMQRLRRTSLDELEAPSGFIQQI
jgi:hypothetical protein